MIGDPMTNEEKDPDFDEALWNDLEEEDEEEEDEDYSAEESLFEGDNNIS